MDPQLKGGGNSELLSVSLRLYLYIAAEQGDAETQYHLGWRYYLGEGVPQNDTELAKWFCKAAEQAVAKAQVKVGEHVR